MGGFAEEKGDDVVGDLHQDAKDVFGYMGEATGLYAKPRYTAPVASNVGEMPKRRTSRHRAESAFERPDLKHREFKRAQKRATMLAFDELNYDPSKKGAFGGVMGPGGNN